MVIFCEVFDVWENSGLEEVYVVYKMIIYNWNDELIYDVFFFNELEKIVYDNEMYM